MDGGYEQQPTGRGRAAKRRVATKDTTTTPDKKRRGVSRGVPKAPAAPPSIDLNTTHPSLNNFTANKLVLYLTSEKPEAVTWALNGLLQATADFNANYCLGSSGEKILLALVKLFDEAIGWDYFDDEVGKNTEGIGKLQPTVSSWDSSSLSGKFLKWEQLCREKLASPLASSSDPNHLIDSDTDVRILDAIVTILRNLSFVSQNLRLMAYTPQVMRVLTGALYYRSGGRSGDDRSGEDASSSASNSANMCVNAIHALINLAPLIDITGRQYFIDRAFLESDAKEITCTIPDQQEEGDGSNNDISDRLPSYGMASILGFGGMALAKQYDSKAETLDASVSTSVILEVSGSLVQAYLALFPALASILNPIGSSSLSTCSSGWHRSSVQATLELLTALMEYPDNNGIFANVPSSMLHHLTEFLFIPRLGPDAMDYIDPISNTVVRVMALKFMRYDATIDTDMRDRACEVLASLTDLSDHSKVALGGIMSKYKSDMENEQEGTSSAEAISSQRINVRLYDSLMSMIASSSSRGDGGEVALRLLSNLAAVPQNRTGIVYVERKLLSLACKDANIARIACSGIFNQYSDA
ncbi:hypothetical protein ACHAXM_011849 [Skeletonema potamos]